MTSGGAGNTMGGGRGILMCISTAAIVGIGMTITNAKSIAQKSNLFILFPPILKWPSVLCIFRTLQHLVWSPRHIYNPFDVLIISFIQLASEMFQHILIACHHHFSFIKIYK
jgi:hypothetical protein